MDYNTGLLLLKYYGFFVTELKSNPCFDSKVNIFMFIESKHVFKVCSFGQCRIMRHYTMTPMNLKKQVFEKKELK